MNKLIALVFAVLVTTAPAWAGAFFPAGQSGTYTPTLTNSTNVASSTAFVCTYLRVGNAVTVSGLVTIQATTGSGQTILKMSLPVASTLSAASDLAGNAVTQSLAAVEVAGASADTANHIAQFQFQATTGTANTFYFTFTYTVK